MKGRLRYRILRIRSTSNTFKHAETIKVFIVVICKFIAKKMYRKAEFSYSALFGIV